MVGQGETWMDSADMGMKRPTLRVVEEPAINPLDRDIIGRAVRLEIPFSDILKMRRVAELLSELAEDIRFQSHRSDHPPLDSKDYRAWRRSTLFFLKHRAREINAEIRRIHGKHNRNGTTR